MELTIQVHMPLARALGTATVSGKDPFALLITAF